MKYLKQIWNSILALDNDQFLKQIDRLKKQLEECQFIIKQWQAQHEADVEYINKKKDKISQLEKTNKELTKKLEEYMANSRKTKDKELEDYWNHKIQPTFITYPARNGRSIDVRDFFNKQNSKVKIFSSGTNDQKAQYCHKWVTHNIHYKSDKKTHHTNEFWQYANETLETKEGDCEDGAILMANMMVKSGIPYWRVRLNAGDVKGGGHAYVTYLREKDNKWYVLDWCYWPNESLGFKKTWKDAKKYFGIWFSFNKKYAFAKDKLDRK